MIPVLPLQAVNQASWLECDRDGALKAKHAEMDTEILNLERHPGADDAELRELKRKKLAVKDEMHRLSATV